MGDETPMTRETTNGSLGSRIDLATIADFSIGALRVRPSRRQVVLPDNAVRDLEPRVMQVLVSLAEGGSEVVSRDQLIERCWDGRIVGDDAVNRCIVALRTLARSTDPPLFEIETFPRIGYSLIATDTPHSPVVTNDAAVQRSAIGRRGALAGLGAVGLLAAGGAFLWSRETGEAGSTNEVALDWYRRGVETREQGTTALLPQVQAHFREAVKADPEFAAAWAGLALAYASSVFVLESGDQQAEMAEGARTAAENALRIDPDNLEARMALAFVPSDFGRWADSQAEIRALLGEAAGKGLYLERLLRSRLSHSLNECGRCDDALAMARESAVLMPRHPAVRLSLVTALWLAGEVAEADQQSAEGMALWPSHAGLWLMRLAFLTYGGRPEEAVRQAGADNRPPGLERYGLLDRRRAAAQALVTRSAADIAGAERLFAESNRDHPGDMMPTARFYAALGRLEQAFEFADAYYLNLGPRAIAQRSASNGLTRFDVTSLFWPPMAPLWRDPRFDRLAEQIGLTRYWQTSGTAPDFRRS